MQDLTGQDRGRKPGESLPAVEMLATNPRGALVSGQFSSSAQYNDTNIYHIMFQNHCDNVGSVAEVSAEESTIKCKPVLQVGA